MSDTMTHSDEVSDERLAEILAAIPRYADGSIRRAWVGRVPAPELEALVTELLSRRSASNTATPVSAEVTVTDEMVERFNTAWAKQRGLPIETLTPEQQDRWRNSVRAALTAALATLDRGRG